MPKEGSPAQKGTTLVVGATGFLGGKVAARLRDLGVPVRALVREGSDSAKLEARGVEVIRGDLTDRESLRPAMEGVVSLVTTAIGYSARKRGDSLKTVDDAGNRNLIDAAREARLGRFVFTSVLACDLAEGVPHFWQKKLTEDYLEASGVPFVSLRPGAFFSAEFWGKGVRKGHLRSFGPPDTRWTYVDPDDVAQCLVQAVGNPKALNKRIDLGTDRPLSARDIAGILSEVLGRRIALRPVPAAPILALFGLFSERMRDFKAMFDFFQTGKYVADTALQREVFGSVPSSEESLRRLFARPGVP